MKHLISLLWIAFVSHTKVDKETNQVYNVIYNMEKKMLYDLRVLPK